MKDRQFDFYATFFKGLKDAAENEITGAGGKIKYSSETTAHFSSSLNTAALLLYGARVLNKVVLITVKGNFKDYEKIYGAAKEFEWENYFSHKQSFKINSSIFNSDLTNSHYLSLKVKDAVCDRFREKTKKRPDINIKTPDVVIEAKIINNTFEAGISLTSRPLFKRNYRTATNAAPLKETLAAGLYSFIKPHNYTKIIDPMCGSGTLIIETAMRLLNIPPLKGAEESHIEKKLNLKGLAADLKEKSSSSAPNASHNTGGFEFIAADKSENFRRETKINIQNAGLSRNVKVVTQDFFNPKIAMTDSLILFNAPYGKRLHKDSDLNAFYKKIGDSMKNNCQGSLVYILTGFGPHIKNIGLKASRKHIVYNGKIECRFLEYEIY